MSTKQQDNGGMRVHCVRTLGDLSTHTGPGALCNVTRSGRDATAAAAKVSASTLTAPNEDYTYTGYTIMDLEFRHCFGSPHCPTNIFVPYPPIILKLGTSIEKTFTHLSTNFGKLWCIYERIHGQTRRGTQCLDMLMQLSNVMSLR